MSRIMPANLKNCLRPDLRTTLYILLIFGLSFAVHATVLAFIFPKYYAPLWPNHDDFYLPISMALSPLGFWQYIWFPRPVGQLFFWLIGHFGLHGSIFSVLLLIILNCALIGEIVRRLANISAGPLYLLSYALYLYLLFSQPHFYEFATHDAFAQLSFLLLTIAGLLFLGFHTTGKIGFLVASFVAALMGFLAKETYGITALFLGFIWLLAQRRRKGWLSAALPIVLTSTALIAALAFNFLQQSPFTSNTGGDKSPYHVVLSPASVAAEWLHYSKDGLNSLSIAALGTVLCSVLIFLPRKLFWVSLALPLSAALAWLPNAMLPNHHYAGYSWSGAYLLFCPILFISALLQSGRRPVIFGLSAAIAALCSPLLFAEAYKDNSWSILQESNQRNLIKSLTALNADLGANGRVENVLVTGINFPFSPFGQPNAIDMFPNMRRIRFAVVVYSDSLPVNADRQVRFVAPNTVRINDYQMIWAFKPTGALSLNIADPAGIKDRVVGADGVDTLHVILYPELLDLFDKRQRIEPDGYTYLKCGTILLSYGDAAGAESCLRRSSQKLPDNPYPYFYLGKAQEAQGKGCLAARSYRRAVTLDNRKSPNTYFSISLKRVNCATGSASDNTSPKSEVP